MVDENSANNRAREEFLTARQLAELLQVSETTVRRLARAGSIPSVRLTPRIIRFQLKAVLQALDGGSARPNRRKSDDADDPQLSFLEML